MSPRATLRYAARRPQGALMIPHILGCQTAAPIAETIVRQRANRATRAFHSRSGDPKSCEPDLPISL
jgi:hypothetical protein